MFQEAVQRMEQSNCLDPKLAGRPACLKAREQFIRVYELSPLALGALRNRAFIEKSLGLVASAVRSFEELARVAPGHPEPSRRQWGKFAQKEAAELEPRVPVLVLEVRGVSNSGAALLLDGVPLSLQTTQSLKLDPGPHALTLRIVARPERVIRVELAERERARIIVDLARESSPLSVAAAPEQPLRVSPAARGWAVGLGIGGGALVLAGLGFGSAAWIQKREACGNASVCEPSGYDSAARSARYANALVGAGLVVAAGGASVHLLSLRATRTSATLHAVGTF